jgi:DNA-binding beta-propeller fold protein YncE
MLVGGDATNKTLLEIDPTTGAGTVIGNLGFRITGLAYDSQHNILYGCSKSTLYRINPQTAAAQQIGTFGRELMHTIEYDSVHDVLYGILTEDVPWQLCTIDVGTGRATPIASVAQNGLSGSAFDPATETMYVSNIYAQRLLTLDLHTGDLRVVGDFGAGIQVGTGMAFHPTYGILAADNRNSLYSGSDLYQIDKYTGAATFVGQILDRGGVSALAYTPEPATLSLLALGLGAVWMRKRRVTR